MGLAGVAIGVGLSWILLNGTAMASRRILLAVVAITLMVGVWIVLPTLVAISLAARGRAERSGETAERRFRYH